MMDNSERIKAAAIRKVVKQLERWLSRQDYDDYNDTIAVKRETLVKMLSVLREAR